MQTQNAVNWWANHPHGPGWIEHYRESESASYRQRIVEALHQLQPWSSLFEIGCHCGPQLHAIQAIYPEATLIGCDVNRAALEDGAKWVRAAWLHGAFPGVTAAWLKRSVDVVLSCYALAYFDPSDIQAALCEAGRIARQGVVICEPIAWDLDQSGIRRDGTFVEWRHPYIHVLLKTPEFCGWRATCHEFSCPDNYISGLIVLERPEATA